MPLFRHSVHGGWGRGFGYFQSVAELGLGFVVTIVIFRAPQTSFFSRRGLLLLGAVCGTCSATELSYFCSIFSFSQSLHHRRDFSPCSCPFSERDYCFPLLSTRLVSLGSLGQASDLSRACELSSLSIPAALPAWQPNSASLYGGS